jgi:hypothetical protein
MLFGHVCTDRIQFLLLYKIRRVGYVKITNSSYYINSYYEERQSILNYIMSYGRRNSYGGGGYGGRRQSNFGGPKPVEMGKEYDRKK